VSVGAQNPAPLRTLAVGGRSNAHVSLAADGRFVAAVWSASLPAGATDIYAALSRDGGTTFSGPVRVNTTPGEARLNGEQPPRVALRARAGAAPEIVVLWTAPGADGTKLLTARSRDGGRTFGRSELVPGTDTAGLRGWHALAAGNDGRVHALWLDHRRTAGHAMHAGPDRSDLYYASLDRAASAPAAITNSVCFCCKTAIAAPRERILFAAWRHVYPGNLRDIAFAASADGGRTFGPPVRVSEDKWELAGCPDDGPAMTTGPRGRIHVVWPTLVSRPRPGGTAAKPEQAIALFHAMSEDGRRFTPRVAVPTERQAHHPQLTTAPDGGLALAWDESGDGRRSIVFARGVLQPSGAVRFDRTVLSGGEGGSYPAVVAANGGALVAWTGGSAAASVIHLAHVPGDAQ
jgi:hypothetical protein